MKKKFIYIPFLFLIFVFFADKVFKLDFFKKSFYQEGNPVYYAQRRALFERMLKDETTRDKKFAVAFGDSRAYPYSSKTFPPQYQKDWVVYNFAGPQAVPAYGFYWFERMIQEGKKPDAVFYVVSPEAFDDSKGLMYEPFLRLGADDSFIARYWGVLSWADRFDILKERFFTIRKIKPGFKLFWSRLLSGNLNYYLPEHNHENLILEIGNGEQLAYAAANNNPDKLAKDALRLKSIYLSGFELGQTQFFFVEEFLKLAKENGVRVYLIWPKVYDGYRQGYFDLGLDKSWWPRIRELASKYGARAANMNELSSCSLYYDASHQSVICIEEQAKMLLEDYYSIRNLP